MKKLILSIALVISTLLSAQERELRGIWVATAWGGIDWPTTKITKTGNPTQIAAQKSELITILDNAQKGNLNAVFFQVRSHEDAMYKSSFEPWSDALSGTRGLDPGYDPLQFAIEEAHKRGLELHAWINPYRSDKKPRSSKVQESWILPANILDPGNLEVQKFTMDVIGEIINNYDIDGLVFDDYFYKNMPANDYVANETHQNSQNNPHNLSIDDWRRENVNKLIGMVMNYVENHKPYLRFGVAPFGIWSNSNHYVYDEDYKNSEEISAAAGISGQDAYSKLYCDAAAWLKRGYIDYISPQLYWPSMNESESYLPATDYSVLCKWWYDLAKRYNRPLITSNDICKNGKNWQGKVRFNTPKEISNQIRINREGNKSLGNVFYNTTYFQNRGGANTHFKKGDGYFNYLPGNHYQNISIQPVISWRTAPAAPTISNLNLDKNNNKLTWTSTGNNVKYAVYSYANELTTEQGCINENLIGITYTNEFNTKKFTDKHEQKWAVRVLDRYANLYAPIEYPSNVKPSEKAYLLGINGWNEVETNLMDEQNGIYTKKMTLPAGSYTFKLKKGERWYGDDDVEASSTTGFIGDEESNSNIRFIIPNTTDVTFILKDDKIIIQADGISSFSPVTYLLGINGWDPSQDKEMHINKGGVYSKTLLLSPNKYSFKIKQGVNWFGFENIDNTNSTPGLINESGNISFELLQKTNITFTFRNNIINIKADGIDKFGYKAYVLGIGSDGWIETENNEMSDNNGIFSKELSLEEGSYTFKIKKGKTWYCFENVDAIGSTPGYYSDGKDKNIRFILPTKANVTFTLNGDKILIKAIGIERFSPITYLLGINSWDNVSENEMPILNGVFTKKETLPANKYSFKIKQDNKWFGIDNISKEESTTGYTSDKDGNICFELPIETEVSFYFSNGTIVLFAQSLDQFGPKQPDLDPIEPSNGIGELRGLYIRTELDNRDWPLSYDIEKQKKDLVNFIKKAKEGNLNAVIIQVRSFCDAIYDSKYEPWSEFLTKQRGKNPGYDPLDFAIQEAHKHGLELHAWISPFRIGAYTNDINIKKEWIISSATANKYNCLDPGNKEVRDYTINVLKDLISRYDIDGLLFDDYFYNKPNSNNETQPIVNINNPHNLSLDDWRRENVNIFISEVQKLINNTKPYLRFGISPIGIYNTSKVVIYDENYSYSEEILPAKGISGTGAYNTTYTDAATLLKRGYIDYISPQLIWPSLETSNDYRKGQDYTILCNWWSVLAKRFNRHLITNNEIEKAKWSNRMNNPKEISNQIQINRKDNISNGTILTRASYYINLEGINTNFASTNDGFHTYLPQHEFNTKSLWPAMTWKSKPAAYKIYDVIEDIENDQISWKCNHKDARFAIYCYPMEMSKSEGCTDEYLVDVTYSSSYKVSSMPDEYGSTRKMSICPIDRYGNRYIVENESSTPVNNEIHKENHFLVYNHGNNLFIELDEKLHNVTIFTVMGQVIYNDIINSNINIILPENIYIVKIDETAQKIIIK